MINPIVIIILAAYILSFLVLRIVVKPKKTIFTGALLLMLVFFVILTNMIDTAIYAPELMQEFEKGLVSFVTSTSISDTLMLEKSFDIFAWTDVLLFVVTIISMCFELRTILISVYSDNSRIKSDGIRNSTEKAQ